MCEREGGIEKCVCVCMRERDTHTHRQTDRQADRLRDRGREGGKGGRVRERERERDVTAIRGHSAKTQLQKLCAVQPHHIYPRVTQCSEKQVGVKALSREGVAPRGERLAFQEEISRNNEPSEH